MAKTVRRGPSPTKQLFKNLFGDPSPAESYELVAVGISASWRNAERLLSDAALFVEAGRLSSARFLITTAREELAKSYLLVDACRLDLSVHNSVIRNICSAFYDHIKKHAYLEVLEIDAPLINSMAKAELLWDVAVERWWPSGDPEYGEPDMPHDTWFGRELPLYIDFGDYDRRWLIPSDSSQKAHFTLLDPISKFDQLIDAWRKADSDGLCTPQVLEIINSVFKCHYIKDDTTREQLVCMYEHASKNVTLATGISTESFMRSPFVHWPLYHLVAKG